VALLGIQHAPNADVETQPQIMGIIRVINSILIDICLMPFLRPGLPSLSPSTEQSDLRDLLSDASNSDYVGSSTVYTSGHSSLDMESPAISHAAISALVSPAPTALRFVDACANISLKANRFAFIAGRYTKLRTPPPAPAGGAAAEAPEGGAFAGPSAPTSTSTRWALVTL
jgi:hypothetical protein